MSEYKLNKIETRPNYIVKGYATTPNNIYPYRVTNNKTFKEYFTDNAIRSINRKAKSKKVFVDVEHETGTKESTKMILDKIRKKTGQDFTEEIDYINSRFKFSEIPLFKIEHIEIDERGLFVEIKGNPFYRDLSEDHKKYFDSVWGSLENGFINGMSLNMKPTKIVEINSELTQIDDVDVYGISLTGSPSNEMASITEVAMRSLEILRGGREWKKKKEKKVQTSSLML